MRSPDLKRCLPYVALVAVAGCAVASCWLEHDLYHLRRPHSWLTTAPRLVQCRHDAITLLATVSLAVVCLGLWLVCERRERLQQAKRLQALKTHIVADVSHDLRTPLTAIKGAASLLESDQTGDRQDQFMGMIRRNCDRLAAEIDGLVDLAEPDIT